MSREFTVARFFEGIERAKAAFDKAPQGKKYAEFFRVMDTTIAGWQAFRAKDAEMVEKAAELQAQAEAAQEGEGFP